MCISIQEQMKDHSTITELIKNVKSTQKKYIKSGYDSKIKKELDSYQEQLLDIPIYSIYLKNLELVNERIEFVKDSLNDYFYHLLNK